MPPRRVKEVNEIVGVRKVGHYLVRSNYHRIIIVHGLQGISRESDHPFVQGTTAGHPPHDSSA